MRDLEVKTPILSRRFAEPAEHRTIREVKRSQAPGAPYYERFIVGLAVVIIVILDQFTARRQAMIK